MKLTYTIIAYGLALSCALAQGTSDYYQVRKQPQWKYDQLMIRYGSYLAERWYVSLDGFSRVDNSRLNTNFSGLISNDAVSKMGWSAMIGWTNRDAWAIEGGFSRSPIHTRLTTNSRPAITLQFTNEKNALFLRAKRQILSTSPRGHRSGFWLSAGLWLIPNMGLGKNGFLMEGRSYQHFQAHPDTLLLSGQTATNRNATGMAELGLEYAIRLSSRLDLGLFVRKNWGLGSSITTDLQYSVNNGQPQLAQIRGTGSGASVGMTLRYTYSRRHEIAKTNIFDLRGNRSRLGL